MSFQKMLYDCYLVDLGFQGVTEKTCRENEQPVDIRD